MDIGLWEIRGEVQLAETTVLSLKARAGVLQSQTKESGGTINRAINAFFLKNGNETALFFTETGQLLKSNLM